MGFAKDVLGIKLDPDSQAELARGVARGQRNISVRSGHGVGKSTALAVIACWWHCTRFPAKTVMTAPSSPQLFDALFAETKAVFTKLPEAVLELFDLKAERIELKVAPTESFISARTSRAENPEALQGVHSSFVLLIADEASGVPDPVFEAAAGSMSGHNATTILAGNPTRLSGFFWRTHNDLAHKWSTLHWSCEQSPRVSREFIEEMRDRYGEDSNAYRVRVLGEFPRRDDDTLIPLEIVEASIARDIEIDKEAPEVWGLDVARFGTDSSALCKRRGKVVTERIRTWRNIDLMQLVGALKAEYDSAEKKPTEILVDVIGMGAGVVDRARELGLPVRGVNVSEAPALGTNFLNLRAELWASAKAWFEALDCKIPPDDALKFDLTVPRYGYTSNGKLKLESKEEMKRRGIRSPDRADAFVLTFAGTAAIAGGWASMRSWSQPLKRGIKGVV